MNSQGMKNESPVDRVIRDREARLNSPYPDTMNTVDAGILVAEIKRLREFEWKYRELCE